MPVHTKLWNRFSKSYFSPKNLFLNFFRSAACSPAELIVQVTSVCVDSATDGRMCDVKLFLKSLLVLEFYSILTKPGTHILRTSAHKTLEQILEILLHSPKVPIFTLKKIPQITIHLLQFLSDSHEILHTCSMFLCRKHCGTEISQFCLNIWRKFFHF